MIPLLFVFLSIPISLNPVVSYSVEQEAIVISGLDKNRALTNYDISIYFGEVPAETDQQQVTGGFEAIGANTIFRPKYGFSEGASYTVIINSRSLANDQSGKKRFVVEIPEVRFSPSTSINSIYPTAAELPMNQLKLYIEFSAPMRIGSAFDHIRLYRLPARTLETEAFLITPDELWDPERRRLTILFDPGRIKRGVRPNLQLGLPLVEGKAYELVIAPEWLDANGATLISGYHKTFTVGAVDRTSPNPKNWTITPPEPGQETALNINFKESMDYALLHSAIAVVNERGERIEGKITLSMHETMWSFYPRNSWQKGSYSILISSKLEDLAGNNLSRKFDVNLNDPNDRPKNDNDTIIPFVIEGGNNNKSNY